MKIKDTENYLINPYIAIRVFAKNYLAVGAKTLTHRKYKVAREAWIASMFLIALSNHSKRVWWLTPVSDRSGSPDFNCYSLTMSKSKPGAERRRIKLEVFEWRKNSNNEELITALQRIKLNKIIDPEITILCYIKDGGTIPPATVLNEQLKNINPKVKDIWYLGDVSLDGKIWRVTQIYPNLLAIDVNYDEVLIKKVDHSFIHTYRGTSTSIEYEPSNQQILLTPEFEMELIDK